METYTCTEKIRDKHNKIIAYKIQNVQGRILEINTDRLKYLINTNQITLTNLKLTSNNKLISTVTDEEQALDTKIKVMVDKAKLLGIYESIQTACENTCHIIHKTPEDHILLIPSNVTDLNNTNGILAITASLMILQGSLKVIGGLNIKHTYMLFGYCSLNNLDLSEMKSPKVKNIKNMFLRADIPVIDLSSTHITKVNNIGQLFFACKTKHINTGDIIVSDNTRISNMFSNSSVAHTELITKDNRIREEYNKMKSKTI